eukprot:m.338398 g.338398  ORF g.338398 m.338398 type:complete len:251 (-) comp27798_c0_seq1:5872-6624(-)
MGTAMAGVAIVTGGSRGIGLAISHSLAAAGYAITVVGRVETHAATAASDLVTTPTQIIPHQGIECDVADPVAVKKSLGAVLATLPRDSPLVLVNSAGISIDGLLARVSDADIDTLCRVNLQGAMYTSRAVLRHMLRRNTGCIVNVGSVVAQNGAAGQSIYAATKAGLEGFTKSLAREVGPKGVRVNVVAPGFTRTAMTADLPAARVDEVLSMIPLQRFADPEDIADAVMYLTRAKYVTGTVLTVDGGLSC